MSKRLLGIALSLTLSGAAQARDVTLDGKVFNLSPTTFAALTEILKHYRVIPEAQILELKAAILSDGQVDASEEDLLAEILQPDLRAITITGPGETLVIGTQSGKARTILEEILNRGFAKAWSQGYPAFVAYVKENPQRRTRGVSFIQGRLATAWAACTPGKSYEPMTSLISQLYGACKLCGSDAKFAQAMLFQAARQLDQNSGNEVPDFLYQFIKPAETP